MNDEWMLRRKFAPVRVDELEDVIRDAVEVGGPLGVDQVVLGVHVDAMLRFPSHHRLKVAKKPYLLDIFLK